MTTACQARTDQPTAHTTVDLRVYLLGPRRIEWAGHPLPIPRHQARALLYCLAARLRPLSREYLCFLFWPDTSDSTARRNLSRLLAHLRRALPAPEVLVASNDHIGLVPERVWSDTADFERLCATSDRHHRAESLHKAVDLYRGPFLPGFSMTTSPEFELWAAQERHAWEQLYLKALVALIEEWTARREYQVCRQFVDTLLLYCCQPVASSFRFLLRRAGRKQPGHQIRHR